MGTDQAYSASRDRKREGNLARGCGDRDKMAARTMVASSSLLEEEEMVCGHWKYSFTPIVVVPGTAPIFEACRMGRLDCMISLFRAGKTSIFDTSQDGWTLLHVGCSETTRKSSSDISLGCCCKSSSRSMPMADRKRHQD